MSQTNIPLKLHTTCPEERIPYLSSHDIPRNTQRKPAQPRALQALELALNIKDRAYNIYIAGETNMGRTYMVQHFLKPHAKRESSPPDLLYVNNFEDPDKPLLLCLPAGQGKVFKTQSSKTIQNIRKELLAQFETDAYIKKRTVLLDTFQDEKTLLIKQMDSIANAKGFSLDFEDKSSLTLYPLVEGKKLSEEEFDKLDEKLRSSFKQQGDALLQTMSNIIRKITKAELDYKNNERNLDKSIMEDVLNRFLTPLSVKTCKNAVNEEYIAELNKYFIALRQDILDNFEIFLPKEQPLSSQLAQTPESWLIAQQEAELYRYEVNLFVDNSQTKGAPIILDDNPTQSNLLGCIERESEMGALVTDFTLIKSGTLHKALGGYLLLHIEDILQHHNAWDGLLRALRSGYARMDESAELPETTKTKGIEPQAIPIDIKIILIGSDELYETLLLHDDRFIKLFKIKAQLSEFTDRNAPNIKAWLHNLGAIIDESSLLPFSRSALAGLVDFSSQLCEDQKKLSLKFPLIREVMLESSALATMQKKDIVDGSILDAALAAREYRQNYLEELFFEEYSRDMIKVKTSGFDIGRVNGLSVTSHGEFEFGLPHQISCTVGVGHGGIIDLEREAELSGPIHIKAMMILKSYLVKQFARNKPLVLTGSICFEQSYAGIEGDSASGAELASLLSALSEIPINLSLAFTGAVSQSGEILAVGGVTRKIEGFFGICEHRGLTGKQGVILPFDNKDNLMLSKKVSDAVNAGKFHIYAVKHITEALSILTQMPCGKMRKNGTFPPDTLFHHVDARLKSFGWLAENAYKRKPKIESFKGSEKKGS